MSAVPVYSSKPLPEFKPIVVPSSIITAEYPSLEDIPHTIFVSGIPLGIKDDWLEKILSTCGNLKMWKRPVDFKGIPSNFGLVVYESSADVLKALRVIEGEAQEFIGGIELQGSDGVPKRLRLSVDPNAREDALQIQKELKDPIDVQSDLVAHETIRTYLEEFQNENADDFLSTLAPSNATPDLFAATPGVVLEDPLADMPPEITPAQKEIIRREIRLFRENTAEKDQEKREREKREVEEQKKRAEREYERDKARRQRDSERKLIAPNGIDITPGARLRKEEEELQEQKRREKRELEMQQAFKEREAKWEAYEVSRSKKMEYELKQVNEYDSKLEIEKGKMLEFYNAYDDDKEWDDDFNRDRNRWTSKRQHDLSKELEQEEIDQKLEIKQAQEAAEAAEASKMLQENIVIGRIMTKEERIRAQKELISKIPADKQGLFSWQIKWDFCSSSLVQDKLKPFVTKKVIEYIGSEELDLIDFIIRSISKRVSALQLMQELQGPLDEDAEIFVLKLWRMMIYETEARYEGIL